MTNRATYQAYVLRDVDAAVPKVLIGPDGQPLREISRVVSAMHLSPESVAQRATVNRVVEFFNIVEPGMPGAAALFTRSVKDCRRVQDRFLKVLGVASTNDKGARWVKPSAADYGYVEDTLYAVSALTAILAGVVFGGQDPSKMDPTSSRTGGAAVTKPNRRGYLRTDTDRRLRMCADPTCAPRLADPRVHERWLEGLIEVGASEGNQLAHLIAHGTGARAFQTVGLMLADVLLSRDGVIAAENKGGGAGVVLIPRPCEYKAVLGYIDGERCRLSGLSLQSLRAMAADPRRRALLTKMPLLTENGIDPIKYDRLYRVSLKAAKAKNLYIADFDYVKTGIKRFVTFHTNRHEYVHSRLDYIYDLPETKQAAAKESLIAYMGWSRHSGMLEWYSQHHVHKRSTAEALAYNAHLDTILEEATVESVSSLSLTGALAAAARARSV